MSGINFRTISDIEENGIPGIQLGFDNDYGINIIPDSTSGDDRFSFDTVSVFIFKGPKGEDCVCKTTEIVQRLGYKTNFEDKDGTSEIMGVTPDFLVKILNVVKNMEVQ